RFPTERQASTSEQRVSRTEATLLNGSSRSSSHKSTRGSLTSDHLLQHHHHNHHHNNHPQHQEVHVCVPLKSYNHLHPPSTRLHPPPPVVYRSGGDTKM
ncbi:hypothetical protein Pcinc_040402, partial [Petrolisthes cinctipes]